MSTCQPPRITVAEGADPNQVWWGHVRAALGEGCCPRCSCRLEPVGTGLGVGGACRHCGHAWATDGVQISDWKLTNPYTGEALPLTRMGLRP